MVLKEGNCDDAHLTTTGEASLAKVALTDSGVVNTTVQMTKATNLTVCYATKESGGNSTGDYVTLQVVIEQRRPIAIAPSRTTQGKTGMPGLGCLGLTGHSCFSLFFLCFSLFSFFCIAK